MKMCTCVKSRIGQFVMRIYMIQSIAQFICGSCASC